MTSVVGPTGGNTSNRHVVHLTSAERHITHLLDLVHQQGQVGGGGAQHLFEAAQCFAVIDTRLEAVTSNDAVGADETECTSKQLHR